MYDSQLCNLTFGAFLPDLFLQVASALTTIKMFSLS